MWLRFQGHCCGVGMLHESKELGAQDRLCQRMHPLPWSELVPAVLLTLETIALFLAQPEATWRLYLNLLLDTGATS